VVKKDHPTTRKLLEMERKVNEMMKRRGSVGMAAIVEEN
jgi:hypothetical protein